MILSLNLFLSFALIATAALTIHHPPWTSWSFINCSYYIIFALTAAWAFSLAGIWQERFNGLQFIKTHRRGILFSFLLTAFIFISVPPFYRILSDETNTLSVARSLTFNKRAENVTEGKWYYEMFWSSSSTIDKRPLLFPFFISLTDTVLGYRPENAFVLNFFTLWASLFLFYLLLRPYVSDVLTLASIVLVMSQPFMCLTATSTSFEILNLFFILSSFLILKHFIINPERKYFTMLCLNLLMLANVRYESFIFLIVIMACLLFSGYIRLNYFKQSAVYILMLFSLLPLIWQRIIYLRTPDVDMPQGSWINAFNGANVGHNLQLFFKYILNPDGHLGFAGIVNWLGIAAICYLIVAVLIKKFPMPRNERTLLFCLISCLAAFGGVIFFYDQARMTQHPMNGRLYMPLLITLSIMPVFAFNDLIKNHVNASRLMMLGALSLFIFYHPIAEEGRWENELITIREYRHLLDFLNHHTGENILLIYSRPGQFVIYNYGAVSFNTANQQKSAILEQYHNRLFNKIYVAQEISYVTKKPIPSDALDPSYNLLPVNEIQGSGDHLLRVSEVVIPNAKP